jgi:REP element-mobilizing transposase RayT
MPVEDDIAMSQADPSRPSRRSLRLPDYDYSQPGAYFVTMVTYQREHLFGKITNSEMRLNDAGKIVWEIWQSLPKRYPHISLDEAVVMPNHFHGIVIIEENPVGTIHELSLRDELPLRDELLEPVARIHEFSPQTKESYRLARRRMLIPLVIGYLKMNSAKRINILLNSSGVPIWQRNYYERIVRNDQAYNAIRQYIHSNPASWDADEENR